MRSQRSHILPNVLRPFNCYHLPSLGEASDYRGYTTGRRMNLLSLWTG